MAQSLSGSPLNLLYFNASPPIRINEAQWTEWLTTEFVPALLESKAALTAVVYREVGFAMIPNPSHPLRYLVLCQTDFRSLQDSEKYKQVYEGTGAIKYLTDEAAVEIRNYRLIQDFNPNGVNNKPSPNALSVEMNPEDRIDFEEWYRDELLPKLRTLKGYNRSKRYQISGIGDTTASPYLAVHEIQDLSKAFVSQKAHEEASTPRMEKHIEASEKRKTEKGGGFLRRGWELVYSEGYQTATVPSDDRVMERKESHDSAIIAYWMWLGRLFLSITTLSFKHDGINRFEPVFV